MKILTESNLVHGVRDGAWMRYTLNLEKMRELSEFLKEITDEKEPCICACDTDKKCEC